MTDDDLLPIGAVIASRHLAFVAGGPILARARTVMHFVAARVAFADRLAHRWRSVAASPSDAPRWPDGVTVRGRRAIGYADAPDTIAGHAPPALPAVRSETAGEGQAPALRDAGPPTEAVASTSGTDGDSPAVLWDSSMAFRIAPARVSEFHTSVLHAADDNRQSTLPHAAAADRGPSRPGAAPPALYAPPAERLASAREGGGVVRPKRLAGAVPVIRAGNFTGIARPIVDAGRDVPPSVSALSAGPAPPAFVLAAGPTVDRAVRRPATERVAGDAQPSTSDPTVRVVAQRAPRQHVAVSTSGARALRTEAMGSPAVHAPSSAVLRLPLHRHRQGGQVDLRRTLPNDPALFGSAFRERRDPAGVPSSEAEQTRPSQSAFGPGGPEQSPGVTLPAVEASRRQADAAFMNDLVDRVVRQLSRQLTIEAERRGGGPWHSKS